MKLTRRNALIGLGSLVAGSGALVGSGAFSSVTAERSVSATIVSDSSALLGLTVNNSNIASINNNQLELSISNLNENAVTVFDTVFTVDNNGNDPVGVRIRPFDGSNNEITDGSIGFDSDANGDDLTTFPSANGDDNNLAADGNGDTVTVGITLDDTGSKDPTQVSYIEIEADASKYVT